MSLCRYSYKAEDYSTVKQLNATVWALDNVGGDPVFYNSENNDFRLSKGSQAIDAGTLKNAFPLDMVGQQRFRDFDTTSEKVDIGCFEFSKQMSMREIVRIWPVDSYYSFYESKSRRLNRRQIIIECSKL